VNTLYLDTETFCETPITHGAYRYAEDAEVMLVAWAWNSEPVEVWDTQDKPDWRDALQEMVDHADRVVIHNSNFDRTVLREQGVHISVEKIIDTMVLALQHSLPGSMGQLCDVLNVPQDKAKDKAGKKLIHLLTKPRPSNVRLRRATRDTHPAEWAAFVEYARLDVDAMRDVLGRLPAWNDSPDERHLWRCDQGTADSGIAVDVPLARSAIRAFQRTTGHLAARASELTGGAVKSTTQRAALLAYLQDVCALDLPDLTGATVTRALAGALPSKARELLEIRQQASATSPAKYGALIGAASSDGRLRGILQFCGAGRTGRDAGRIFQPQNLPRSSMTYDRIQLGIEAMKADCEDLLFDNISELCASAVRGALVAAPEHKLVVADLSNIEGRMAAWLAGEQWKLDAFRAFDRGDGADLYVVAYARSFGVPVEAVLENKKYGDGSMRQIGKVQELSLQYQGGPNAFGKMAGALADKLSEDDINAIVQAWRKAHPAIKSMWYDLEGAARSALRAPGDSFDVRGVLRFDSLTDAHGTRWLRMRLPSGRYISYCNPEIGESGGLSYEGVNQYTRQWARVDTYGGKFFEQACQASSRDVFMLGFRRATDAGYPVVLRVHDELVCEVPDDPAFTHEKLAGMMAAPVSWAVGLPLAAAGFESLRYKKD
jgi:DNA polymerase